MPGTEAGFARLNGDGRQTYVCGQTHRALGARGTMLRTAHAYLQQYLCDLLVRYLVHEQQQCCSSTYGDLKTEKYVIV